MGQSHYRGAEHGPSNPVAPHHFRSRRNRGRRIGRDRGRMRRPGPTAAARATEAELSHRPVRTRRHRNIDRQPDRRRRHPARTVGPLPAQRAESEAGHRSRPVVERRGDDPRHPPAWRARRVVSQPLGQNLGRPRRRTRPRSAQGRVQHQCDRTCRAHSRPLRGAVPLPTHPRSGHRRAARLRRPPAPR